MAEDMYVACHIKNINAGKITATRRPPPIIDFHNEIVEMYVAREGVERERGRQFIRSTFARRMRQNKTLSIMENFRQNINSAFYIKYNYSYVLENNETRLRIVYYKPQRGSPWINTFADSERWLNAQENQRLNLDNIDRPNTK